MNGIEVRVALKCTVATLDEATDAVRNAAEGAVRAGWEVASAVLQAEGDPEEGDA